MRASAGDQRFDCLRFAPGRDQDVGELAPGLAPAADLDDLRPASRTRRALAFSRKEVETDGEPD